MRLLRSLAVLVAAAWVVFCGVMFVEMTRPPAQFAAFMSHLPGAVFLIAPFETMWNCARRGHVEPGDQAPDFKLQTLDGKSEVAMASLRGRPVVLIFGSYT